MRAIQPGRPQSTLQAVDSACWEGRQIICYISGCAIVILDGPQSILQSIYVDPTDDLVAIVLDELSGKIAACSSTLVHVYKQDKFYQGEPRWSLQCHLPAAPNDRIRCLSWGLDEELLVGSSSLTLFSTHNAADHVWTRSLASPVKIAELSYDTSLIATTSQYDKLVKIWRRLSLADQRFEFDYLPHPSVVTGLCWRRPFHRDQSFDNILYTFCADSKLRIWSPGDNSSHHILQLWAEIDLMESIQPRHLEDKSNRRFAFMIHSRDFTLATERAVRDTPQGTSESLGLHHLIEVANRSPEICVVLDEKGNMSAWGIENIGSRIRTPGDIFNVAHVEGLKIKFSTTGPEAEQNVQFLPFCSEDTNNPFSVLIHHFDGRLQWHEGKLERLFDPSPQTNRLSLKISWTGHSSEIKKVVRSVTGKAIISRTCQNESVVWTQRSSPSGTSIHRSSTIDIHEHIHRAWLLQDGNFVAFLHHDSISLWDSRQARAVEVARKKYKLKGKPLCLLCIPEVGKTRLIHLAVVSSQMKGISWEVSLPSPTNDEAAKLEEFDSFDISNKEEIDFILAVDPAGTLPVLSGFLDTFARDVAISYTKSGQLTSWTVRPDLKKRKLEWLVTSSVETYIENPSLASGTSIRKAALINSDQSQLTIWSTKGESLEYEECFNKEYGAIQDLDWSSTPDNQSILAVGFPHRVIIYSQLRYDYIDSRPSWAPVRDINVLDITSHPIGDSVWLGGGSFAIGAGHQMIVLDHNIPVTENLQPDLRLSTKDKHKLDIFTLVSRLNGPLPVYHPQYLAQFILQGKVMLVQRILLKLWKVIKFYTEGDPFDSMLGMPIEAFSEEPNLSASLLRKELHSSYADFAEEDPETVTEEVAASLNELLTTRTIPLLSSREQYLLADTIECIGTVEKYRRSMDENGSRFFLFFRQHALRESQHTARSPTVSWREITWAFHSISQDILSDLVIRHYNGRLLWESARECGIFMWMTDITALRAKFEVVARNEYTKSEDRNPVACSLFYLALRKKAILAGLWRMAIGNGEQVATQHFLKNNFNESRWKTAALKNAYALMGKRRFAYAASFFLLADRLKDAVSLLSNQLGDIHLAIAVARVYEGDDGPVLQEFLLEKVLPLATMDGNRWMATWALWMLRKRDKAVQALILPLAQVLSPPETPKLDSKLFSADDPALIVLYKQLREKSLQTLRGALSIKPRAEWQFVMHTARLYSRMGCDIIALELVRSWEFFIPPEQQLSSLAHRPFTGSLHASNIPHQPNRQKASPLLQAFDIDPRRVLRRRSSLVVDDLPADFHRHSLEEDEPIEEETETNGSNGLKKVDELKPKPAPPKPKPTQFHEPEASSILDSFGF